MSGLSLYGSGLTITEAQGPNYYLGTWDASTNTPTLASSTAPAGPAGSYYVVSVSGTTNLNGISDWTVGDWAIWSGIVWQKLEGGATTMTVGSTNIASGTTGRILYDNSAVLGETSGWTTDGTALTGGASTTLAIGGATIGTNALAVTPSGTNAGTTSINSTGDLVLAGLTSGAGAAAGNSSITMGSNSGTTPASFSYVGNTNTLYYSVGRTGTNSDHVFKNSAEESLRIKWVTTATYQLLMGSGSTHAWTNGAVGGTIDTGISRTAAKTIAIGNGTQGDTSGKLIAAGLTLGNGSAGTPSLNFGDATTGLYRATANTVSFSISGAETLRIAAANGGTVTQLISLGGNLQIADSSGSGMWQFGNASKTLVYQASLANGTYIDAGYTNPSSATGSGAPVGVAIGYTWNTTGNPTLIKANVTNTASGSAALLMDLQVGGSTMFNISKVGEASARYFYLMNSSGVEQVALLQQGSGILTLLDSAQTSFNRLQIGGTSSSFPAIKRNSTALNFRLADDSADAPITAGAGTFSGVVTVPVGSYTAPGLIGSGTNNAGLSFTANQVIVSALNGNSSSPFLIRAAGSAASLQFQNGTDGQGYFDYNTNSSFSFEIANTTALYIVPSGIKFLGATSSYPYIKRNGTALNFRLADDSADAPITASTGTFSSYVKTTPVTVSGLPAAATAGAGARAFVTDATATTFASIVAGSGSNGVPVYSDGTNWRIG
jgi:hypothetical protein